MALELISTSGGFSQHDAQPRPRYAGKVRNADQAMNKLRMKMYNHHYAALAERVGVSPSCILAIRSGRTTWPRPQTFFGLLRELELEMLLVDKGYT